jgi:hypothetical protein
VQEKIEFSDSDIEIWVQEDEGLVKFSEAETPDTYIAEKYAKSQLRVVRETKDFNLDYLSLTLKSDSVFINVAPDYQRRQRWSKKKRSQLIESFLLNIPIPPIFLYETDYSEYEVVDGRQRIETIREFFSNNFALSDLEYWSELNNKRFNELPPVIQKGLARRSLSAVILLAESRRPEDDDLDVRRALFERLNTGGEKLTPQELRNALYPGLFNKMLIDIARSEQFASVWGIPLRSTNEDEEIPSELASNPLYKTMADCELVLRYFALKEAIQMNKKFSLNTLLDKYMKNHANDSSEKVAILKDEYLNSLNDMISTFNGKPFRVSSTQRPNRSLYDALMVARALYGPVNDNRDQIQKRLQSVIVDNYDLMVGSRKNVFEAIADRIKLAKTILYG